MSKMSYSVSLLKGSAYSANYKAAVDTLKERFGCKEVVISAHMDALLKLQLMITRKLGKEKWDLDALQNAFKEELEAREMCEFVTASRNDDKGKGGGGRRYPTTAEALLAQGQYERKGGGITCYQR
jgi:hypothetical protein